MDIIHAIVLGLVEGITEFLPVSSTAHLIITSHLLGIPQTDYQKFFEVFIQAGAILAVVILYFQYILKHRKLMAPLLVSFVPTAIVGLLLHKIIKGVLFDSMGTIAVSLALIGIVFIVVERLVATNRLKLQKSLEGISLKDALIIGIVQSLAVVPGVSRAGAVIVSMMFLRYKREDAALYSFLLAVPTILAASLYDLYKSKDLLMHSQNNLAVLAVGSVVSFVVAYLSVRWLIGYLRNNTLVLFGYYRIVLAIIVVLLFLI
ncbi:undecaprenyl-diphosphate phosphatase [Candidatus Microgenomates bacterium]|nr:undecaprenyl-diphosphate phosphatase [Candidatus Microgenomates bacterium]